jgi:hypothetical protein
MIWMNILLADYITWERQCQPLICSFIASLRGLNCRIGFWLKTEQEKQEIKLAHNYSPNLALLIHNIQGGTILNFCSSRLRSKKKKINERSRARVNESCVRTKIFDREEF